MYKPVNTLDNVCKKTEVCCRNDLNVNNVALTVSLDLFPRIVLCLFISERNSLLISVELFDKYLNLVANRNNLGRILYSLPGKFG